MTEAKKFNLGIFDIFVKFAGSDKKYHKIWVEPERIVLSIPKQRNIMYTPETPLFTEEFGINDIVKFSSMLSLFSDVSIKLELPNLIMSEKNGTRLMTYRTGKRIAFEGNDDSTNIILRNKKVATALDVSRHMEEEGQYFGMHLDAETIAKLKKASSILASGTTEESVIRFEKMSDDDTINVVVKNATTDNIFVETLTGQNHVKMGAFSACFNANYLLDGNWDVKVYPKEDYDYNGTKVPRSFFRMEDKTRNLSMSIVYKKEI